MTRDAAFGVPCVPTLSDLPDAVDAVVIATPAATVGPLLAEAGRLACGGAIVYAAGFAELGRRDAQDEAMAPALALGLPVLGPNCNGVVAAASRAPLWGDSVVLPDEAGSVAVVTQSGNVGVVALGHRGGAGLHTVVSVGNAAVVDSPSVVRALAAEPGVRAMALYLEADGDGAAWAAAFAACAERDIRLAVLKVGRTAAGRAAGQAHTAALAGDHRVFAALVAEAGGVLVDDPHDLLETARALSAGSRSPGGVAVLTCSGGDAAMAADLAGQSGARLAMLGGTASAAVAAELPAGTVLGNPLDHTNAVWADTGAVRRITAAVAAQPDVGHLLYIQDQPPSMSEVDAAEWAATRRGAVLGAEDGGVRAIVVAGMPGQEPPGAVGGIGPALAATAALQRPVPRPGRLQDIATAAASIRRRVPGGRGLAEHEVKALLAARGTAVPRSGVTRDTHEAAVLAERMGFPVAVKVSVAGLLHKSEAGALALGLADADAVTAAAQRLLTLDSVPGGGTLLVEAMAPDGLDMFVAARADGVVPVVVLGLGGIWAELLDDIAVIALPVTRERVVEAVDGLRCAAMLNGGRGGSRLAVAALADVVVAAAALLAELGCNVVELNPVRLTATAAVVLDAVVTG